MKFCSLIALQRHLLLLKFDLNYAEKTCRNWLDVKLDWLWQHEGFQIDQIHLFAKFTKFQLNMPLLNWEFCNMLQCIQQREYKTYNTRNLGVLRVPTFSWKPFAPLDFVLWALRVYDDNHHNDCIVRGLWRSSSWWLHCTQMMIIGILYSLKRIVGLQLYCAAQFVR